MQRLLYPKMKAWLSIDSIPTKMIFYDDCNYVVQIFVYSHNVYEISKDYKYSKGKKEE